jgi:hypothetical protein
MKPMADEENDKIGAQLSFDLVASNINLARVFAAVARSAYDLGNLDDGESARLKAIKFYCEAVRPVLQMTKDYRESFSSELQNLRIQIEWLPVQKCGSNNLFAETHEDASMKHLLKLLAEKA